MAKICEADKGRAGQNAGMKSTEDIDPRWRWHQRTLLELRRRQAEARTGHRAAAGAATEAGGMISAEQANDRSERDVALAELDLEEAELAAIDAALQRIRTGTYGICVRTGRPISAARLRALPWTPYSRAAAERLESRSARPKAATGASRR